MFKYEINLIDNTLLMATSPFSVIYSVAKEITEKDCMFIHIGDTIVRKHLVKSIREVNIDE